MFDEAYNVRSMADSLSDAGWDDLQPILLVKESVPYPRRIAKIPQATPTRVIYMAEPVKPAKQEYRNAKCACGSGMKYKYCCARK